MKKEIKMAATYDDGELYIHEASEAAVKVIYGYATGNQTGLHNELDTFAIARAGVMLDGEFIGSKEVLGWNPEESEDDEVDWEAYEAWVEEACQELLAEV